MNILTRAIFSLRPNSEFVYENNDYSTIIWHKLDGDAPTQEQIDDAIKAIEIADAKEEESKIKAKNALLERLGITEDEAKFLLS